ncbi:hypothetical protein LOTGIDRAFT_158919 [Lottia gigantea]|uniref:Major facilitator superfamily (MFS) profile domain-containing protein n=1 Tax=Lottia gigantea TaxID=225164 RepID=V4AZ13_LOTGI|nr:hypothetical protein LOTGIDRAFT_158919 [Lottia gigantea]ESO98956.1 hypothetical protein LOTGIDRAFT_158919 [Lottia gigantea]
MAFHIPDLEVIVEQVNHSSETTDKSTNCIDKSSGMDISDVLQSSKCVINSSPLQDVETSDLGESVDDLDADDDADDRPIDTGWAWMVAFACMMIATIIIGYLICLGILFVEFLKLFDASATSTTLIFGVMAIVYSLSSFISMQVLLSRFSIRQVISCGAIITSLGILGSVFAQNVTVLICTQSVFVGIGQSMIVGPNVLAVSQYFRKRRAFAISLTNSGISFATVLFPMLCRFLLDTYGLRGTLLIFCGIELNIVVFSLLIRPLPPKPGDGGAGLKQTISNRLKVPLMEAHRERISRGDRLGSWSSISVSNANATGQPVERTRFASILHSKNHINTTREQGGSSSIIHRLHLRPEIQSVSTIMGSMASIPQVENITRRNNSESNKGFLALLKGLDFSVCKRPLFHLITISSCCGIPIYIYLQYLPAIFAEFETSDEDVPIFLCIIGALDFVSRLAFGYFADTGHVKISTIMIISITIAGINCQLMTFYTNYGSQFACVTIFGIFSNIYGTFLPVLCTEFLGIENLSKALGFLQIAHGAIISGIHPIIGLLKDTTGTYISSYHFIGALAILAAILHILEPIFRRLDNKQQTENKDIQLPRAAL